MYDDAQGFMRKPLIQIKMKLENNYGRNVDYNGTSTPYDTWFMDS